MGEIVGRVCSWVALLQLHRMMLGRTSAFLIYPCMAKPRVVRFKILLFTGRIQDSRNLSKQLNINMSHYQVCSMEMSGADSAAPQHIPLQPTGTGAGLKQ